MNRGGGLKRRVVATEGMLWDLVSHHKTSDFPLEEVRTKARS